MLLYHNTESEDEVLSKTGVATFINADAACLASENILLMLGQLDPNEIVDGNLMFIEEYRKKLSKLPLLEIMEGHNHISYYLGLGLDNDPVGKRVLEFIVGGSAV